MALYYGWRFLGPLACALPRPLAYALAGLALELAFLCWPAGRRAMRDNLRAVLATDDPAVLSYWAGRQRRRYGAYLVDAARLESNGTAASRAQCGAALRSADWPAVETALRSGPVIFALMHFGNWDVCAGALSARLSPGSEAFLVPADSLGHPALNATMQRTRAALGLELVPVASSGSLLLRALKSGRSVAVLFDRPLSPDENGVDVTFCGRPCRLPAGMARLALASGARVVPAGAARRESSGFVFAGFAEVGVVPERTGDRARDVQALTQAVLDVHEPWVRRHPDQWYQFRPFFSPAAARPADASSPMTTPGLQTPGLEAAGEARAAAAALASSGR